MSDIADKIRKLLRLAASENEHEAALAAARAQELILKHNISEDEVRSGDVAVESIEREGLGIGRSRIPTWQRQLAAAMARSFLCRSYTEIGIDIIIVGRKTNREAMRATWYYLRDELERLAQNAWARYRESAADDPYRHASSTSWKRGFFFGAVQTIHQRLADAQKQLIQDTTGAAIVLASRAKEVEDWLAKAVPNIRQGRRVSVNSATGFREGRAAGHALDLTPRATASHRLQGRS